MASTKRPSTSSLRRFITSRPYVPLAEIRRRFGLEEPDEVERIAWNGSYAFVGLPEREATKLNELVARGEIGLELSVEVRAPVVVGVYPLRIARYVVDQANGRGHFGGNGQAPAADDAGQPAPDHPHGLGPRRQPESRPASAS
jgi:hypothetical protein